MTPSGSATPGFKKGQPHSLLQSALGISRPPSEQGRSRVVSGVPSSKQIYVAPTTISTAQQFHEHFSHLTSSLSHSQDSAYRAHLEEVSAYGEACKIVGEELQHSEETVDAMMGYLKWVEERGESLRIAGETLMQEEVRRSLTHKWNHAATDISLLIVPTQPADHPSIVQAIILYLLGASPENAEQSWRRTSPERRFLGYG